MLIVVFILLYIYSVFGNRENLCGQLMIYTMKIFERIDLMLKVVQIFSRSKLNHF